MTSLGRALLLLITVLSPAAPAMAQNIPPPTQNVWVTANPNSPIPVVPSGGNVTTTPVAITPVAASSSLESNHILKASGGNFFGVQVNTTSASEWVMLFNATTLPSNGAVTPVAWWQVNASSTLSVSETPGLTFGTGVVIGCSTTGPFTLTASALCTFGAGIVQ